MAKHGPDEGWRRHVIDNVLPRMEATAEQLTGFTPAPANPQPFSAGMHLQPSFDVIELLPPVAAEKMRLLRPRSADAHTLIPTGFDIQALSAARVEAANSRKRLTDHPQDGGFGLPPTDARVVQAQQALDRATETFERIKQRSETKTAAWQAASGALANIEAWLKSGRPGGTTLLDHDGPEPTLLKGEKNVVDAIENRRRRVRELRADLHRIASAPYPSSYAKQQMRAQIEQLSQRGEPSVSRLVELDGPVEFQTQRLTSDVHSERRSLAFAEVPDTVALIAWLHKDALIKRLDELIGAEADDGAALSHEARQQAEAEVQGDLLAVEREESFFVWQAQAQNLPVEHRFDCDPRAILQIELLVTPRATELPPSSPERAGFDLIGGRR